MTKRPESVQPGAVKQGSGQLPYRSILPSPQQNSKPPKLQTPSYPENALMPTTHLHPLLSSQPLASKGKIVTAEEAVRLIRAGDTVATGGFVGIGFAEYLAVAL